MRISLVLPLTLLLASSDAAGFVLTLRAKTLVLETPNLGDELGAHYMIPSLGAGGHAAWTASQPVTISISDVTFDFSETLPVVTVAPFTVTVSPLHLQASLPFGVAQTLLVTARKDAGPGVFAGGTHGITVQPDGSIALDLTGLDVFQTTTFTTPIGPGNSEGGVAWTLGFSLRNVTPAGADLGVDYFGTTNGPPSRPEGFLDDLFIQFDLTGPGWFYGITGLRLAPPFDIDGDGVNNETDNCPFAPNPDQLDRGGLGGPQPDGIGDACQCGDVTGDGRVTPSDAAQMRRGLLVPPTATMTKPALCDVGGSDGCSTADAAIVLRALLQPPAAAVSQACGPSRP